MNKNKNIPKLRFPEFKDSPEWEGRELGLLVSIMSGMSPSNYNLSSTGSYPFLKVEDLNNCEKYQLISREYASNRKNIIPAKSVIFPKRGAAILLNKLRINVNDVLMDSNLMALTPNKSISVEYLYYMLGLIKLSKIADTSSIPQINNKHIIPYMTVIPKPKEQEKIAECLSSVDELITAQADKIAALKEHKKGLMQKLFPQNGKTTPRYRFPEFKDSSEWEIRKLNEISKNLDNRRVPITEKDRVKGNIPYYGASGIIDFVSNYIFNEDLLCISEDGANLVTRTYPVAFSISGKTWVNNHAHVLKFKNKSTHVIVKNYINSIKLDDFVTGIAQPKLNRAMLDSIPICLPIDKKYKEQEKIAECLGSLDELISLHTEKLSALKDHKKGLMQQLFPTVEEE